MKIKISKKFVKFMQESVASTNSGCETFMAYVSPNKEWQDQCNFKKGPLPSLVEIAGFEYVRKNIQIGPVGFNGGYFDRIDDNKHIHLWVPFDTQKDLDALKDGKP